MTTVFFPYGMLWPTVREWCEARGLPPARVGIRIKPDVECAPCPHCTQPMPETAWIYSDNDPIAELLGFCDPAHQEEKKSL